MNNNLVSVVIPVYNVDKYLDECLNSIINQTYKNLEIIIVNDGSTDKSKKIIEEYRKKDNRVQIINKENGGLSSARNVGIDVATGEYICFIDSDDIVSIYYIEQLLTNLITSNSDISICCFQSFKKEVKFKKNINRIKTYTSKNIYSKILNIEFIIAWNKLYKIDLFKDIRYPEGKIHEDVFTTYKLIGKSKKVVLTLNKLYAYRNNYEGITKSNYNIKRLDEIEGYEEQLLYYRNNDKMFTKVICTYVEQLIFHKNNCEKIFETNLVNDLDKKIALAFKELKKRGHFIKYIALYIFNKKYVILKIKNKIKCKMKSIYRFFGFYI